MTDNLKRAEECGAVWGYDGLVFPSAKHLDLYTTKVIKEAMKQKPIESAPKNKRLIVGTENEVYCANWVKNPYTDDEAWLIGIAYNDQILCHPKYWFCEAPDLPLPTPPQGE